MPPHDPDDRREYTSPSRAPMTGVHAWRWSKPLAIGALAILALAALGVVFVLPDAINPPDPPADARVTILEPSPEIPASRLTGIDKTPAGAPARPVSQISTERLKAQDARQDALRLQARLENAGARDWADKPFVTSFPEAMRVLATANGAFEASDFARAAETYANASVKLRQLEENRPGRLRRALDAGEGALADLDTARAERHFRHALVIDPGNADATAGIEAAGNLRRAIALSETGAARLAAGELEAALAAFEAAVAADPGYAPGQAGLDRVTSLIAERDFGRAMSRAISALDGGEFAAADRALADAARIRPSDPAVRDLRQRIAIARQTQRLRTLQANARRFETAEAWGKAVAAYEQALRVETTSAFAIAGLARARKFEGLNRQIDFYLDTPGRLQSDKPAAHARTVLEAANRVAPAGPVLMEKRRKLAELLEAARSPVPVRLVSDGKTRVTVYRVARFGAFADRRVNLVPGRYTAVGSRDGYRDVRVTFEVPLRSPGITIDIRCTEPI